MTRLLSLLSLVALSAAVLPSCQRSVPSVPASNRTVVAPKGSTDVSKSWSILTKTEGDAVLGPLSNVRR